MKTKEEVVAHLLDNGYTKGAINKIMGFLLGSNLKEIDEFLKCKTGDGKFEDFYDWFYSDDEGTLFEIMNDIAECCDNAKNSAEKKRYLRHLKFLAESFDVSLETSEE